MRKKIIAYILTGALLFSNSDILVAAQNTDAGNETTETIASKENFSGSENSEECLPSGDVSDGEITYGDTTKLGAEESNANELTEFEIEAEEIIGDVAEDFYVEEPSADDEIVESGIEGTNITWTLYKSGVLKIDGTGKMPDYGSNSSSFRHNSKIKQIIIGENITRIGDNAFVGCSSLTNIEIPDGVTSIGKGAFKFCSSLTSITIPDGVTSISDYMLDSCSSLTSITIPGSVISIGRNAFYNCDKLVSITIPDSVTNIRDSAFWDCDNLMSIVISDSVESIDSYAFYNCNNLMSIYYEGSLKSGSNWGALNATILKKDELVITAVNRSEICGSLTGEVVIPAIYDGKKVIKISNSAFSSCTEIERIVIPEGVRSIGISAFYGCSALESITLPDSMTNIGSQAFYNCNKLTSITMPDEIISIEESTFFGCSGLTSVTIPESVTSIGNSAFSGCSSLASVIIPASVTSIGNEAFSGCSGLTNATISEGVTNIGERAFSGCAQVKSVTLPDTITSLGQYAFESCTALDTVKFYANVSEIPEGMFYKCSNIKNIYLTYVIGKISIHAFRYCDNIECIYYNGTDEEWQAVEIENYNGSLEQAQIFYPSYKVTFNVNSDDATDVEDQTVVAGSKVTEPEVYWEGYKIEGWYVDEDLQNKYDFNTPVRGSVSLYAKWDLVANLKLVVDKDLTTGTFNADFEAGGFTFHAQPDGEFTTNYVKVVQKPRTINGTSYTNCFQTTSYGTKDYRSISFTAAAPADLYIAVTSANVSDSRYLGVGTLDNDDKFVALDTTYKKDGETVTPRSSDGTIEIIGSGIGNRNTSYVEIKIPKAGEYYIYSKDGGLNIYEIRLTCEVGVDLTSYKVTFHVNSDDATHVEDQMVVVGSKAIEPVTYWDGHEVEGWYTDAELQDKYDFNTPVTSNITLYAKWKILTSSDDEISYKVTFHVNSDDATHVEDQAVVVGSKAIEPVTYWDGHEIEGWYTDAELQNKYDFNTPVTSNITLYAKWKIVTSNDDEIVDSGTAGDDITWTLSKDGILRLTGTGSTKDWSYYGDKRSPFCGNANIEQVIIGEGIETIGSYIFFGCSGLTSIEIPESLVSIGSYAFRGCSSLSSITIPENVIGIGSYAFSGCSSLSSITIPENVISIGGGAFSNCSGLQTAGPLEGDYDYKFGWRSEIPSGAFSGCSGLTSIELPESVTSIGDSAFRSCSSLTSIELSESVTSIGWGAFGGCSSLTSIKIPEGVTSIDDEMFGGCRSLTNIEIPESVIRIGEDAFMGCDSLTSIHIPDSVASIGMQAFEDCTNLMYVTLPDGLINIEYNLFAGCSS